MAFRNGDVVALRGCPRKAGFNRHWSHAATTHDPGLRWPVTIGHEAQPVQRYDVGVVIFCDELDFDRTYLVRNFLGHYQWFPTSLLKHANQEEQEDARVQER